MVETPLQHLLRAISLFGEDDRTREDDEIQSHNEVALNASHTDLGSTMESSIKSKRFQWNSETSKEHSKRKLVRYRNGKLKNVCFSHILEDLSEIKSARY